MKKILFICKLTITYSGQDPIAERLDILQTQLIHFLDLWKPECYYNPGVKNAYNQFGVMDKICVDEFYFYRYLRLKTIPHVSKLCESVASLIGIHHSVELHVDYPESLPLLCPAIVEE